MTTDNLKNSDVPIAVCSRSFSQHPLLRAELSEKYSCVKFNDQGIALTGPDLVTFLKGCRKAIIGLEKIDEKILTHLPDLNVISKYGVGLDEIDFYAMEMAGVSLGWTPGINAQAVAELTLCMALNIVRSIQRSHDAIKFHKWTQHSGQQLSSMTYGILGCGHVGKALVKLLKPFGGKIISYDIENQDAFFEEYGVLKVDFNTLIETSNILSIHIPKNQKTMNIINKNVLNRMMKGAFLINTARGGLVDEIALLESLNNHHIAAAGLDVFAKEPLLDFSLVNHPNVFATPHIGGSSEESILAMGRSAIFGLDHFQKACYFLN
jgi:D-3-phosphoglycerate dehydrogenase